MNAAGQPITGGCQCGAVRFAIERLGRASICHCRMCQKAFGSFYGPLVTGYGVRWTRGAPKWFASSTHARRGFCAECGTPLAYDAGKEIEIAIGALDTPELAAPALQVNPADKLSFVDGLPDLPHRSGVDQDKASALYAGMTSHQHPDHDTEDWPPQEWSPQDLTP